MLSMQSNMEIEEVPRWTATESSDSRPVGSMSSDEVLLEWFKRPDNYGRYVKGGGPNYPNKDGRCETRTDMAREVLAMLEAAGYQGRSHIATNQKMMSWARRYKKAHQLACSGANEFTVRKTFLYYYELVDYVGNDSDLPINIRETVPRKRRSGLAFSSSRDVSLDTYLEGSPLSSAASLSPSPGPDYLSSSSSSAYSQADYVPHMPIIPSNQPDSSTLCSFSEQNIINGPRRLPVPSIRQSTTPTADDNNNNNNSRSRSSRSSSRRRSRRSRRGNNNNNDDTTHHHCQTTMQRMMETLYQQQEYHNQQMSRLLQQNQELLTQQARSHRIHEMQVQASLMVSVIDQLGAAGLSKNQISAHLLQLNGASDEEQQQQQQQQQLIPQQDQ